MRTALPWKMEEGKLRQQDGESEIKRAILGQRR